MSWRTINVNDITGTGGRLAPGEVTALQNIQGTDVLPNLISDVVGAVRGYIAAGGNAVGPDGTVPDQLRMEAIDLIVWRWLRGIPGIKSLQSEARKQAHDDAVKMFEKVANRDGGMKVEVPDNINTSVSAPVNATAQVSGNNRHFTRHKLQGL